MRSRAKVFTQIVRVFLIVGFVVYARDSGAQSPPATYPSHVDVGVAGVTLNFRQSAEDVLGADFTLENQDTRHSRLVCRNSTGTEELTLVHHAERGTNTFQEFHVQYVESRGDSSEQEAIINCVLPVVTFRSTRGVSLGMSLNEITSKFGERFRVDTQGNVTVLTYSIETNLSSPFLKHYDALSYYGRYYFKHSRLIRYSFGLDNL